MIRRVALAISLTVLGCCLGALPFATDAAAAESKKKAKSAASDSKSRAAAGKAKVDVSKLDVLARFSTRFACCEPRTKNIRRMVQLMDGVVIEPGHSFSLNHFIGARTEDKGFVMAPSILDLEYTETVGGGVSQFATTLYNALYTAGFPILEHKPHSHYISRYPAGVEATLSWPGPDLAFKNDSEAPLVIKTTASRDRVSVKLLGRTPGRKVERKSVELERRSQPTTLIGDASVPYRKPKVDRPGSPRRAVQVTRVVTNPGKRRVDEEVVIYLASKRVLRVHPCKLPRGHKDHTGEPCGKPKKKPKGQ